MNIWEKLLTVTSILHNTHFMWEHSVEFLFGHRDPFSVSAVDHHDDKLLREDAEK